MRITDIRQTVFLRGNESGTLDNMVRMTVSCVRPALCRVLTGGENFLEANLESGENVLEIWIPEPLTPRDAVFSVLTEDETASATAALSAVRHWEVYFLQWSHHDTGYTDLPSRVFDRHCEWYDDLLSQLDRASDMPQDARPRAVVEQFWSLDEYLRRACADKAEKIRRYIRSGDIELTALYGNLITEQLGHEECFCAMFPAVRFARKLGVDIVAASHNDIPGVSWGLCRALCDAGIRYFVPDFPDYYAWGGHHMRSFWDDGLIWNHRGPDAFRWEAADGKRITLWSGRHADTVSYDGGFGGLEGCLDSLAAGGYPYDVIRLQGKGATTDNSPFSEKYSRSAAEWNKRYAYPHITIATNRIFFSAFEKELERKNISLPVVRGELPGQDYPLAAMSMAEITSAARRSHVSLPAAEKLLSLSRGDDLLTDPAPRLGDCWRDLLLADDHAYGHHFPAGPAMRASYWEKGVHAMRCEAEIHDMMSKAAASVADRIGAGDSEYRLVVFNMSGYSGDLPAETPLRPLDCSGTELRPGNREPDLLKGYILNNRRHAVLPDEFIDGFFDLVDMKTGEKTEYQIDTVSYDQPEPYAAERDGLGHGTRRYGFFEDPRGLLATIRFVVKDMPPYGYRAYKLVKRDDIRPSGAKADESLEISNSFYRIKADESGIRSIIDRRDGRDLLCGDSRHRLGDLLVRYAHDEEWEKASVKSVKAESGPVCGSIMIEMYHEHLPKARIKVTLWQGSDQIDVSARILCDAAPLRMTVMAFPLEGSGIRYQGLLNEIEPVKDFMPGSQSDYLAVQDWIQAKDTGMLLTSRDTAMMSLGGLHRGYVSPAHSCIADYGDHPPLTEDDYTQSQMFAVLSANNFGTNFMCSQVFDGLYRFVLRRCPDGYDDTGRGLWGEYAMLGTSVMLTDRSRGNLPPCGTMLDTGDMQCLSLRYDGDIGGFVIRLWNHSDHPAEPSVTMWGKRYSLKPLDAVGRESGRQLTLGPKEIGCFAMG